MMLSDEQVQLRDEIGKILAEQCTSESMRRVENGLDPALWSLVCKGLGWPSLTIAEEHGGLGLGLMELVLLMEQAGARLAPLPLWPLMGLAVPVLSLCDSAGDWLPRIAAGEASASVACNFAAIDPFSATTFSARNDRLSGEGFFFHPAADLVIVPARRDNGSLGFYGIEKPEYTPLNWLDPTRQVGRMLLDNHAAQRLGSGMDYQPASTMARVSLAAEQIGAAQGALDLTLNYIATRVQFGRTIASFQAVKHQCAMVMARISEARSLCYALANEPNAPDSLALLLLARKTLWQAAETCLQLHGGVGMTLDYDPHFYLRRAQESASLLGLEDDLTEALAAHLMGAAA